MSVCRHVDTAPCHRASRSPCILVCMNTPEVAPSAPAWRRRTDGEHRWPAALAVLVAVVLQLVLPADIVPGTRLLLPVVEVLLLLALLIANPYRIDRESTVLR